MNWEGSLGIYDQRFGEEGGLGTNDGDDDDDGEDMTEVAATTAGAVTGTTDERELGDITPTVVHLDIPDDDDGRTWYC